MNNYKLQLTKVPQQYALGMVEEPSVQTEQEVIITSPDDASDFLRGIWDQSKLCYQEQFLVVCLDNRKKVIGWSIISEGGRNATVVEPAMIFQFALLSNAKTIIVAHNHPSGKEEPSTADIHLTKRIAESGEFLGVQVDDHIIITKSSYTSLREERLF